ncbi:hypothetical protein [Planctomicrobium sp. SH527]|uniref:hypothetical protein n=1 Tax=Planctomicrobium sp. SH527 TaxID=3448123 RepID=UPI003F5C8708
MWCSSKKSTVPGDGSDIHWLLITTLPIKTAKAIGQILDYYQSCWMIGVYFRTLEIG